MFRADRPLAPRRPWPLTALCLCGALALAWTAWHALRGGTARAFGPGYGLYFGTTAGALAVALWGLWHLRRWAPFAFPAALLLDTAVVKAMGEFHWGVLVVEAGLVLVVFAHLRAFTQTPR
jgi:hypothetical protein